MVCLLANITIIEAPPGARSRRGAPVAERESLNRRFTTVRVKRDLLQERLNAFLRMLFDAASGIRGAEQKDLLFNETGLVHADETPSRS